MENLYREYARLWHDAEDASGAGGCDHTGAAGSVNIVARHLVERRAKPLWPRVEVIRRVLSDKEITAEKIARFIGIRFALDVSLQIRMIDVNAIVQDGNNYSVALCGAPGLSGLDDRQMPLRRDRLRCHEAALELRDKIRERKYDLLRLGQFIRQIDHALGDILPFRIERDDLIVVERIAIAYRQPELVEHAVLSCSRHPRLESDHDFSVDHSQGARAVAKDGRFDLVDSRAGQFGRRGKGRGRLFKSLRRYAACNHRGTAGGSPRDHGFRAHRSGKRESSDTTLDV